MASSPCDGPGAELAEGGLRCAPLRSAAAGAMPAKKCFRRRREDSEEEEEDEQVAEEVRWVGSGRRARLGPPPPGRAGAPGPAAHGAGSPGAALVQRCRVRSCHAIASRNIVTYRCGLSALCHTAPLCCGSWRHTVTSSRRCCPTVASGRRPAAQPPAAAVGALRKVFQGAWLLAGSKGHG